MSKRRITIEASSCEDCKIRGLAWCNIVQDTVVEYKFNKTFHPDCPLKTVEEDK